MWRRPDSAGAASTQPAQTVVPHVMVTILPMSNGVRLVAATTYAAVCYHWRLYRDQHVVQEISGRTPLETVAIFDLTGPIIPVGYWIELRSADEPLAAYPRWAPIVQRIVLPPVYPTQNKEIQS